MQRRSESEWRRILDRQRDSGLNDKDFAEQENLGLVSLRNWRQRIKRQSERSVELVEVTPLSRGMEVELRLANGVLVKIRNDWGNRGLLDFVSKLKAL